MKSEKERKKSEITLLKYLKQCDESGEKINLTDFRNAVNASDKKFIWYLRDLKNREFVDNRVFDIDPQDYLVINILNSPIVTDKGLEFIEEGSFKHKIISFISNIWDKLVEIILTFIAK